MTSASSGNCANGDDDLSAGVAGVGREEKRFATLQARAALAGVMLYAIEGEDGEPVFVVSRWNLSREMRDLDEVELWLGLIGGAARV